MSIISKTKLILICGWLGPQLLAWCGLPLVIQSVQQGHSDGVSGLFLAMWGIGELLSGIYVYNKHKDVPLLVNYAINLAFILVIMYYML